MSDATTLPPTLSIKDPDTRQFLDQLINVLDLRSGNKDPSSTDRFVTLGDLTSAFSGQSYGLSAPGSSSVSQAAQASQSAISSAIGDLTNSIQNSLVYRLLESPIDLIDIGPIRARLSQTEQASAAAIVNESEKRSNKDNALASAINTMWASIGGSEAVIQDGQLAQVTPAGVVATKWDQVQATIKDPVTGEYIASAAIKETAQTAVDKTGQLEAQYTVKVDVNGYVSGFGLASTANNSAPFSDFIVRADRFSIASPSGPGIAPTVPFIVTTTPSTVNGAVRPAGAYINDAFIGNAAIDTAKIKDAAVDTLRIKGNAVTIPSTYNIVSSGVHLTRPPAVGQEFSSWQEVARMTVVFDDAPSMVAVFGSINLLTVDEGTYNGAGLYCRIRESVTGVVTPPVGIYSDSSVNMSVSGGMSGIGSGARVFILEVTRSYSGWGFMLGDGNITAFGAKR